MLDLGLEEAARGGKRWLSLGDGRGFEVDIPRGVRDGQRIRLAGRGRPGVGGGPPGDLFLRVRLKPHPRFRVEGRDLYVDLAVSPWEAALGAEVPVPTLDGTRSVKVPPGSSSGRRLGCAVRGCPGSAARRRATCTRWSRSACRSKLTKKERELFEQLAVGVEVRPPEGPLMAATAHDDTHGRRRLATRGAGLVGIESLAREAGMHPELARRLIRLGLIEPRGGTAAAPLFARQDAPLLARAVRLRRDLGLELRRRRARLRAARPDRSSLNSGWPPSADTRHSTR